MRRFAALSLAFWLIPGVVFAAEGQFAQDRVLAERSLGKAEQQRCLSAFSQRVSPDVRVKPAGQFQFNEYLSRNVYQSLFWQQSGRGVAFTVPVHVSDPVRGEIVATLGCFYAISEDGISFQQAQQIAWKL